MKDLRIEDRDGVRWIELNRPETRNGLTVEFNRRIIAAVNEVATSTELRVLVIAGADGNFCSGLDLKAGLAAGVDPDELERDMRAYFHGLIRAVRDLDVPTIAAVDGPAVGYGCDLALACDMRIVSDRATFAELFVRNGIMPDGGSTYMLPRIVGLGRALELVMTGDRIDAAQALAIGLANRVVPVGEFADAAWALAERLAKGPPLAYAAMKRACYAALDSDFESALEREVRGQMRLLRTADFAEGVQAFLHKRSPNFQGK